MDMFELLQMILSAINVTAVEELDRLDEMLESASIPYRRTATQICYYGPGEVKELEPGQGAGVGAVCSVIAHGYGSDEGLLEIRGLMTDEEYEREQDTVLGYLTAEDVFARIRKHYDDNKEK